MTAPAGPRFVAYYRVSTDAQGRSGLGVEAQKQAVLSYLMPTIKAVQAEGAMSLRQIAAALTSKGVPTPGGGNGPWNAAQVQRVLIRQGWQTRAAGHP